MEDKGNMEIRVKRIILALTVSLFVLLSSSSCNLLRFSGDRADKIILITLDTTRADHLGCYGYKNIDTPNIDRIASEGILFGNATSQVPMTLPSHSTILTGLYPPNHGVRNNTGYVLRDEMKTIAEILKEKGYKTGAAISGFVLDSQFGTAQGFDSYDQEYEESESIKGSKWVERKARRAVDAALDWLEKNKGEKKLFFWLHLYDPHTLYSPPEPFLSKYKDHPYDGEIAYMDSELGRFFDYLKSINIYDEGFFVICGDHGEGLGEHGESTHELLLYESTMRIPFLIKSRNFKGNEKAKATVSTVDIFPTIMQACGIKHYGKVDGKSLFPLLEKADSEWEEEYYIESMAANILHGWSQLKGIRKANSKYIDCPSPELYELENDPHENDNRFLQKKDVSYQFQDSLKQFENSWVSEEFQKAAAKNLDDETMQKLMSLGYIGSPSAITDTSAKDPKMFVEIHEKISIAASLFGKNQFDRGIALLKETYPSDMENKLILFYLGMANHDLGNYDEAIRYLEILINLHQDHLQGYKRLADLYLLERKWDKLKETMENALAVFPDEAELHYKLALTLLAEQRPEEALPHIERAIDLLPGYGFYYLLASKCYLTLQEREKAIDKIEQASKTGFDDFSILFRDPAFAEIVNDPAIRTILQKN